MILTKIDNFLDREITLKYKDAFWILVILQIIRFTMEIVFHF